jgi:hypothetical protein
LELQELEMGPKTGSPEVRAMAEAIRKEIPEGVLAHYDRLMERGKKGVAWVRQRVCTGCMLTLASGVYADLVRDEDIHMCDACGRYLLLAPEERPGAASRPVQPGPKAKPAATGKATGKKRGRKPKPPAAA